MKVQLCQVNPCVGDLAGNLKLMQSEIQEAVNRQCDVVVFPELVTTAYPPRDLLYKEELWESHERLVDKLHRFVANIGAQITVIFGGLDRVNNGDGRWTKYNAAFIIDPNSKRIVHKKLLPEYSIFLEQRWFHSGLGEPYTPIRIQLRNNELVDIDVLICEDIWGGEHTSELIPASYKENPIEHLSGDGPIFVINGSPFWKGKILKTRHLVESIADGTQRPVCWVNQVGAHDDIITGGYSMVSVPNKQHHTVETPWLHKSVSTIMGRMFAEDRIICNIDGLLDSLPNSTMECPSLFGQPIDKDEDFDTWCDFTALKLYLIDYCRRTGFTDVVLGLSGGLDSAVVCAIAALALGTEHVHGVTLPSKFSSEGSWKDAEKLANNLNISSFQTISIREIHSSFRQCLLSGGKQKFNNSVSDENLQARIRANILMALSNDYNWLLLGTGNKSELAVGFCSLAGDMVSGCAVINDIYKTDVFRIARMLNKYSSHEIIPISTIDKPPSAELREDQVDSQSLPEYDYLDMVLTDLIENGFSLSQLKAKYHDPRVDKIWRLFEIAEYKRKQMPVGAHLRQRSFTSGWSMPIAKRVSLV